ncbi:unnamed protein product [Ilex paraguariensis]|uniref:DNA-directed RNA polymerase subunit beta n=1 Tax=Ilex paraguariensis TaxID=185542 RepID=A0ABC8QME4_9AQUA
MGSWESLLWEDFSGLEVLVDGCFPWAISPLRCCPLFSFSLEGFCETEVPPEIVSFEGYKGDFEPLTIAVPMLLCMEKCGCWCALVMWKLWFQQYQYDFDGEEMILQLKKSFLCYSLGVEDLELLSGEELHMPNSFLVILNGLILGKHRMPQRFASAMRKLRRAGKIGEFVSIFANEKHRCVYIASDGGRVCRPLVIADKGVSRIKEHHMKELKDGVRTFDSFLRDGLIEYLDVNEENNALIALYEGEATPETTHIEIEPFTILGVCAGLIPYPHHNQSPRNTYQCAMGKQAMGNIAYNQLCRMDTLIYLLVYPQRPLLTTRTIELVGYDKLGAGQNATVAVMSYSGYDIEDAIVMNKSSLDHGFGRCIVMKKLSAVQQKYDNNTSDRIIGPQREGRDAEKMQILDDDGLAAPGEIIRPQDVYINKESPVVTRGQVMSPMGLPDSAYKPSRQKYHGSEGETAVVDRVALCSDKNNNLCIKFMIRHTRRPEVGDKFSSRHGQKGVCGTIVQQEDFPFSERGICPDLIMNPHGFPRYIGEFLLEKKPLFCIKRMPAKYEESMHCWTALLHPYMTLIIDRTYRSVIVILFSL